MTISTLSSVLCALAVGAIGLTVRAGDNPAQAAARMALAKQLLDANAAPASSLTVPAGDNPAQAAARMALAKQLLDANTAPASSLTVPAGDNPAQSAARMALAKQLFDANAAAKAKQPKPVKSASTPGNAAYPGADLGLKQIAPPPLPFSATKADRLAALLEKYQADQISPEEYHQQRAAILAEP